MNKKPYIGITGAVNKQEVEDICKEFTEADYTMKSFHLPMLGFLISYKTLNSQPTLNRRYPNITKLPELLEQADNRVLTMIHYNSGERDSLVEQVSKLFDGIYSNGLCRAIQLNIVWPDTRQVKTIKDKFPEMKIVFQASHKAMVNKNSAETVRMIKDYEDSLDYVLIDPSGGRGIEFNIEDSLGLYSELREHVQDLTIGFAGGFNGGNVLDRLRQIIAEIGETNFFIDAEGGLRDKLSDDYGNDLLNIKKVRAYLQASSNILK